MKSTFGALNTVTRGLYAQQIGLDTVGHNISNASTAGYSRQTVNLSTTRPATIYGAVGAMQLGTGVDITSITRVRDTFMDKQMWKENSTLGYSQTSETTLGKIENIFRDELPDIGIQSALNKFWDSLQTLSTSASNDSARTAVREQANAVVNTLKQAEDQLKNLVTDINSVLDIKINAINRIASELYSLNKQISNVEVGGRDNANDLRDRRDLLIDQLSAFGETRVFEDQDHNYVVQLSNVMIADGYGYQSLATESTVDSYYGYEVKSVVVAGSSPAQTVSLAKGEVGAYLEGLQITKQKLDKLDTIAKFFLKDFNNIHKAGYGTDDISNRNFFDNKTLGTAPDTDYNAYVPPAQSGGWLSQLRVSRSLYQPNGLALIAAKTSATLNVTQSNALAGKATVGGTYNLTTPGAYSITITGPLGAGGKVQTISYDDGSGPVAVSADANGNFTLSNGLTIAIGSDTDNTVGDTYTFAVPFSGNGSGDNAVKLSNALKTVGSASLGGASLDEFYASVVGEIGIQVENAKQLSQNQQTLIDQIKTWREAVAGVNMDEEMTNMIKYQKGYNAAARIITTIDEMLDKLINGTGVVGR